MILVEPIYMTWTIKPYFMVPVSYFYFVLGMKIRKSLSHGEILSMTPYRYKSIVKKIQELISREELSVGEKLPPERTLARTFKVSRNSVRQAIQLLSENSLIESRQGDGNYILEKNNARIVDTLARTISAEKERLRDILEFRQCLEPQIARLAASSISPDELERLTAIVSDQEQTIINKGQYHLLDEEFHNLLALASGNSVMMAVFKTLNTLLNESRSEFIQNSSRRKASVRGHRKIIKALEQKDPAMAQKAMEKHIQEVERIVLN